MSDENNEGGLIDDSIKAEDTGFSSSVDKPLDNEGSDAVEGIKAEVQQAIEEGASAEEVKQMIKEYELKVNGKTVKRKVDLSNDQDVKRILQREMAGQQAMQEAAELKKLYGSEIERLKANPWDVLRELGLDPDDLAEARIKNQIEELKKTPEQIENERIRRELNEARQKASDYEKRAEESRWAQLQNESAVELESEIQEALSAYTSLPQNPMVIQKIADHMLWAMENAEKLGIKAADIKVKDVLPSVEREIKDQFSSLFDMLGEDAFEEYIGKRNFERMRKRRISNMKASTAVESVDNIKETVRPSASEKKETGKTRLKSKDYFRNMR